MDDQSCEQDLRGCRSGSADDWQWQQLLAADGVTATYSRVAGESASPPTYHITADAECAAAVLANYIITNDGCEFHDQQASCDMDDQSGTARPTGILIRFR